MSRRKDFVWNDAKAFRDPHAARIYSDSCLIREFITPSIRSRIG